MAMRKIRVIENPDLSNARELVNSLDELFRYYDRNPCFTEVDLKDNLHLIVNDLVNVLHLEF